jgi:3-oxoacyl-[acyl-carrier protein] reductase
LEGKVAVITGAGQGLGRAYAHRFIQEGARVVVADIQEEKVHSVVREVQDLGGKGTAVRVDVSEPESVRAMIEHAIERFGQVDVLVNNAAIFSTIRMKPFEEISLEEWNRLMAVNLTGSFLCCQAVSPHMRERKQGRIINISSGVVLMGRPWYAHYVASKAGIIGLTRALAKELGEDNITINAITPGPTQTEVPRETVSPEQAEAMIAAQAIHRRETPEDLVGVAVFLASEDSSFITGQVINVDGGLNFN